MIQTIVTDTDILSKKCTKCLLDETENGKIIDDLIQTGIANRKNCVGLAANQIGYNKRIVIILLKNKFISFINPVILPIKTQGVKRWFEGCLSFPGREQVQKRRFKKIKVKYNRLNGEDHGIYLTGFEAAIMQHEVDHLNGVLI